MLARANRVIRPDEFRSAVRRGRRVSTAHAVLYLFSRSSDAPARFGFIVTKAVGTAVTRNLVKRRMRAISRELLNEVAGSDLVVRALPGIDSVPWTDLRAELMSGVERGLQRR